jgi:hypothetical protein
MGGFGSIAYPERHPGLYDAAAALSGAVDIEHPSGKLVIPVIWSPCAFGDPLIDAANWHANNPTANVERLRGISLFVQSGNGVPGPYDTPPTPTGPALEALIHDMNVNFVAALKAADIPVTVRFYGDGAHPDGVGPSRFYDFDGMRLFLDQAMPLMTTPRRRCARRRTTFTLPRRATHVRLRVDGKVHPFRRHGRKLVFKLPVAANAEHRIRITARRDDRRYSRTARIVTCASTRTPRG